MTTTWQRQTEAATQRVAVRRASPLLLPFPASRFPLPATVRKSPCGIPHSLPATP